MTESIKGDAAGFALEAEAHNREAARLARELARAIEGHAGSSAESDLIDAIRREIDARDDALEAADAL